MEGYPVMGAGHWVASALAAQEELRNTPPPVDDAIEGECVDITDQKRLTHEGAERS